MRSIPRAKAPIAILTAALALVGQASVAPAAAESAPTPGGLDTSFDGDGKVVTTLEGSDQAMAIQPDGRIVVVGFSVQVGTGSDFTVVRYDVDGSLDESFGGDGVVVTPIGPGASRDEAFTVALQPDGRIVVAGDTSEGSTSHAALARYNADGTLDPAFGGDGIVTTQVGSLSQAFAVAVDGDGRTLVAGDTNSGGNVDFALVRYLADGTLDAAFGTTGVVTTPIGSGSDHARGMAVQNDGRIVVAGHSDSGVTQNNFAAARYHGDAPPDITAPAVHCGSADSAWHPADANIACTASDAESGLADAGDAGFSLSTNVAAGTEDANASTNSRQVCDLAGNCATAGPISGNMVDRKDPAASIASPAAQTYLLNQPVSANYSCADGGSGIATCSGPAADGASLDTAAVGTKDFIVSATDGVGNEASQAVSYVAYDPFVLYDPAKPTRRIKLRLHDALGANVSSLTTVLTVESIDSSTGADGTFDYSKGAAGYAYAVDTRGLSSGSHTLEFTAGADPTVHSVPFVVR